MGLLLYPLLFTIGRFSLLYHQPSSKVVPLQLMHRDQRPPKYAIKVDFLCFWKPLNSLPLSLTGLRLVLLHLRSDPNQWLIEMVYPCAKGLRQGYPISHYLWSSNYFLMPSWSHIIRLLYIVGAQPNSLKFGAY